MNGDVRRRLTETLGSSAVAGERDVIAPSNAEAVAAAVRVCADTGTHITVSSHADGAALPAGAGIVLNLNRLQGVTSSPEQLILRAEAGATLVALRGAAARARLAIVGLVATVTSEHVGALIARGEVPRRSLCGIEAVLSSGEAVTFGGGVLKDVVGYDLPALMLGSLGRLAIIVAVTFRLEPEAAKTPVAAASGVPADGAHTLLVRAFDPQGLLQPAG